MVILTWNSDIKMLIKVHLWDEASFSTGSGSILNLTFLVNPNDSISTALFTMPEDSVSVDSYNFSIGEPYSLDINFWEIEDSFASSKINFLK